MRLALLWLGSRQMRSNEVADIVPMQLTGGDEAAYDGTSTTCCRERLHADVQYKNVISASQYLCIVMWCVGRGAKYYVSIRRSVQ